MDSDIYRVDSVITKGITVLNTMSVKKLHDIFVENSSIMGVTVIKNSLPIGIITRERLMLYLSGRFGYSLYEKKTVDLVMDINYLSVDLSSNINEVAIRAMDRSMHKIYDFIVVVKKGAYYGVIEVRDLLLKYTEISVMRARNLNPLSGLPGNCEIEEEIKKIISTNEEYTVMYIDIDNFKVFNDNYGFDKGDKIILTLSDILKKYMLEGDFIGHIGGDDFIFIKKGYNYEITADNILSDFEKETKKYYGEEDRQRGYVYGKSRKGESDIFGLVSLTIAIATNRGDRYLDYNALMEALVRRKAKGKASKILKLYCN